jgi:hypothetical protein
MNVLPYFAIKFVGRIEERETIPVERTPFRSVWFAKHGLEITAKGERVWFDVYPGTFVSAQTSHGWMSYYHDNSRLREVCMLDTGELVIAINHTYYIRRLNGDVVAGLPYGKYVELCGTPEHHMDFVEGAITASWKSLSLSEMIIELQADLTPDLGPISAITALGTQAGELAKCCDHLPDEIDDVPVLYKMGAGGHLISQTIMPTDSERYSVRLAADFDHTMITVSAAW